MEKKSLYFLLPGYLKAQYRVTSLGLVGFSLGLS